MSTKKRPIRAFLIFICIMALVTYFSRQIYLSLLPGVEVGYLRGGRLYNALAPSSFALESEDAFSLCIPFDLSDMSLYVQSIDVRPCDEVTAGQTIVSFDKTQGAAMLEKAVQSAQEAQSALEKWDIQRQTEIKALEKNLEDELGRLADSSDIDSDARKLRLMRDEVRALREEDVGNIPERAALATAAENAAARAEALALLAADGWALRCEQSGIVCKVHLENGAQYAGLLPICGIIPIDAQFKVSFVVANAPAMDATSSVDVQIGGKAQEGWVYDSWRGNSQSATLTFCIDAPARLKDIDRAGLLFTSNMYQFIIPNSALDGGSVYVLNERSSAFGGMESYVTAVMLTNAPTDGTNTAVTDKLSGSDRIVTHWNRPIGDGDAVNVLN